VRKPARRPPRGCIARLVWRIAQLFVLLVLVCAVWSAFFIWIRCRAGTHTDSSLTEASTYLTLPEWYIVYNTEEYARFTASNSPTGFPYVGSIRQYWRYYGGVCDATKGRYRFSGGNHLMLAVIGSSFSIEYSLKGIYENTAGRLTDWINGHDTPEDAFAHATAVEYGQFMHTVPWYEFPFGSKLAGLWRSTPAWGPHPVRKWERKLALSSEYAVKGAYGWLIGLGTGAAYDPVQQTIEARVRVGQGALTAVRLPRYEAFTIRVLAMIHEGAQFTSIDGNDEILVTAIAPRDWRDANVSVVLSEPLLVDASQKRIAVHSAVTALGDTVRRLEKSGARIEHLYDY